MKPESQFEKDLEYSAPIYGCQYWKIPDVIPLRGKITAHKRPFDGVMVTPNGNLCVECKIGYIKLKTHQIRSQQITNTINKSFVVLRKIFNKKIKYRIELADEIWETDDIKLIFIKLTEYMEGK